VPIPRPCKPYHLILKTMKGQINVPEFPRYPPVNIVNATGHTVSGKVHYATLLCRDDDFGAEPFQPWTARGRGSCLVTRITATAKTPGGNIAATPYASSGTSYSQFAVIQTSNTPPAFEVIRRVSGAEDEKPRDYVEPTTEQK
jgi:hypothetical protein